MKNKKYYIAASFIACGLLIGGGLLCYGILPATFITTAIMAAPLVLPIIGIIAGMTALFGAIVFASKVNDLEINHNKLRNQFCDLKKDHYDLKKDHYELQEQVYKFTKEKDKSNDKGDNYQTPANENNNPKTNLDDAKLSNPASNKVQEKA